MSEPIPVLRRRLNDLRDSALGFFDGARKFLDNSFEIRPVGNLRVLLPVDLERHVDEMRSDLRRIMTEITVCLKRSPMITEPDVRDLSRYTRTMDASLNLKEYKRWGVQVHHDEDVVLGVDPPGQREDDVSEVAEAEELFKTAYDGVLSLLDYWSPEEEKLLWRQRPLSAANEIRQYRPSTAFIIMRIDPSDKHLDDIRDTVVEVFKSFKITARRADDIEHSDKITDKILDEIATAEFLFADLTGARPSVYYEIGYAHAIGKRPMLFCAKDTTIHFDLKDYNCPAYDGLRDLRTKLTKRLSAFTRGSDGPGEL
jgi:nucleoside 2-deoxyribosyltransferase